MIGQGQYSMLSRRITGSGRPSIGQKDFARRIAAYGMTLVFNMIRGTFEVYVDRGRNQKPWYVLTLYQEFWPLNSDLARACKEHVGFISAVHHQDLRKAMDTYNAMDKAESDRRLKAQVDDIYPDLVKDLKRTMDIMGQGKRLAKTFDMAGA